MEAKPIGERPVTYGEFRREVAEYRPEAVLRWLAAYSAWKFEHEVGGLRRTDPLLPWAVSLLAREALTTPGRATQRSPRRRAVTDGELRHLGSLAIALEDPLITETLAPRAVESFLVRTAFQQFEYQEPVYHGIARMRPMFDRSFPRDRFEVLSADSLREVLGAPLDAFVDSGQLFAAVAMKRCGVFNPRWLQGADFEDVRERISVADLLAIFHTAWAAPWKELRSEAIRTQSQDPCLRQHDWNPFVGRPFVKLSDGQYVAPQYWYVASRVRPSAVYYLGVDRYGDAWARDLGHAHEDYIRLQLRQLEPAAAVYGEFQYETRGGTGKTVDAIVVLGGAVVLIEAKSLRARLDSRHTFAAYTDRLQRDMEKAFRQVGRTAKMIRDRHPALGDAIPDDRPMCGLVVTPEPLWLANNARFTARFPDPAIPIAVASLRELEDLVAWTLDDYRGTLWLDATRPDADGDRNPHAALYRYEQARNRIPTNPVLAEAYADGAWR